MRLHRVLSAVLLLLLVSACIDDPTAIEEEGAPPLSEEEIAFLGLTPLVKALEGAESAEDSASIGLGRDGATTASPALGLSLAPMMIDRTVSTVVACENGGEMDAEVGLSGVYDDATGAADLTFTMVLTPDLCRESSDGFDVTLFGDPNLTVVFEFLTEGDGVLDIQGSITGGLGALTDGRVAECSLDVAFSGTESEAGTTLDVQGEVCGRSISERIGSGGT